MCNKCNGKGFIESWIIRDAATKRSIRQCFDCGDVSGYTREVQRIMQEKEPTPVKPKVDPATPLRASLAMGAKILPFRKHA